MSTIKSIFCGTTFWRFSKNDSMFSITYSGLSPTTVKEKYEECMFPEQGKGLAH
jgi:hypothetical protein